MKMIALHVYYAALTVVVLVASRIVAIPLPAPINPAAAEDLSGLMYAFQRFGMTDTDRFLAQRFPQIPAHERGNVGVIPKNLYGLVQGADEAGRLTLPTPQPGHALLLTKDIPQGRLVPETSLLNGPSGNAGKATVRGIGAITDHNGKVHYFRTIPFDPPLSSARPSAPTVYSTNHIPPRDRDGQLFGSRPITFSLPDGGKYHSSDKVMLSHISVLPLSGPNPNDLKVYPRPVLNEILAGPPMEGKNHKYVEWSEIPNWSSRDRKLARQADLGAPSSPRWLQKLKKTFMRSGSGSRLLKSGEGSSSDGSGRSL